MYKKLDPICPQGLEPTEEVFSKYNASLDYIIWNLFILFSWHFYNMHSTMWMQPKKFQESCKHLNLIKHAGFTNNNKQRKRFIFI